MTIATPTKPRSLREMSATIDQLTAQILDKTGPRLIEISNKIGKVKLGDVSKAAIEKLLEEIGLAFGATAAKNGMDFGPLTAHAENGVDVLEIEIHSPGGSVFDGLKFYHELIALRSRGVKVVAHINSLAASMGSVIAMAADEVSAVPHAKFMLHEVSSSSGGTAADHERSAKLCEQLSNDLAAIYARRSKRPLAEVRKLMLAETWLSAPEALAAKFIDRITGTPAASTSLSPAAVTQPRTTMSKPTVPTATANRYADASDFVVRQAATHRSSPAADKAEAIREMEARGFTVTAEGITSKSYRKTK